MQEGEIHLDFTHTRAWISIVSWMEEHNDILVLPDAHRDDPAILLSLVRNLVEEGVLENLEGERYKYKRTEGTEVIGFHEEREADEDIPEDPED